jgi:hypothetical protein
LHRERKKAERGGKKKQDLQKEKKGERKGKRKKGGERKYNCLKSRE